MTTQETGVPPPGSLPPKGTGLESQFFGKWGAVVRYLCGMTSVFTMCLIAYMDAVTTRISIQAGHGWPGEWHFLIMTVGVTICAMSFSNANKTISTILSNTGLGEKAKSIVMRRLGTQPVQQATGFYWWNAQTRTFLTVTDVTDLSDAGFIRVTTPQPSPGDLWDTTSQTWISVK